MSFLVLAHSTTTTTCQRQPCPLMIVCTCDERHGRSRYTTEVATTITILLCLACCLFTLHRISRCDVSSYVLLYIAVCGTVSFTPHELIEVTYNIPGGHGNFAFLSLVFTLFLDVLCVHSCSGGIQVAGMIYCIKGSNRRKILDSASCIASVRGY